MALACTTPYLLALFNIVTLLATRRTAREKHRIAATAWYSKLKRTFTDALVAARYAI